MTPKQKALQTLACLPEDSTFEELQQEVRVLAALEEAEREIEAGHVVSHEEVKRRLMTWTSG